MGRGSVSASVHARTGGHRVVCRTPRLHGPSPSPVSPSRCRRTSSWSDKGLRPRGATPRDSVAEWTGLEPATPGVTGRYSNQLNYHSAVALRSAWWVLRGSNPRPSPCKGDALPAELSTPKSVLVYGILQGFASLEARHFARRNLDCLSGLRIASGTCRTMLDRECAETHQHYLVTVAQRSGDGMQHRLHRAVSISMRQFGGLGNCIDQFSLLHGVLSRGLLECGRSLPAWAQWNAKRFSNSAHAQDTLTP